MKKIFAYILIINVGRYSIIKYFNHIYTIFVSLIKIINIIDIPINNLKFEHIIRQSV